MKKVIYILSLLTILVGVSFAENVKANGDPQRDSDIKNAEIATSQDISNGNGFINVFENLYRLFMRLSLPVSLDNLFKGSVPETPSGQYIGEMFKLADLFEGIIINVQEGDMPNAKSNFQQFKIQYQNVSTMVPEWKDYWNTKDVSQLETDLNNNDVPAIFQDAGKIGKSCSRCHGNEMPQVWAKYYWRDFDTVNVSTPDGEVPWVVGMSQYLDTGYSGIGVNIREGKQKEAIKSFNLFKTMLLNFKQACNNCHTTPRYYFVSNDVLTQVNKMGLYLKVGKLADAEKIREQLGDSCVRCHVLHIPAQEMKGKIN